MNQQLSTASQKPLRVALIGLNGVNRWMFLPAIQRSSAVTLVAGVSPSAATRESFGKLSSVNVYDDLDRMLGSETLDAVIIGSPTHLHLQHVRQACEARLHALVTKPLCNTLAECRETITLAREAGTILHVGHEFRYRPPLRRLIELGRLGDTGPVGAATILMMHMGHAKGLTEDPATATWRCDSANVPGGSGNLLGVHGVDLANALFGTPRRVQASLRHLQARLPFEDTTAFTVEYDGATAVITTSYVSQPLEHAFLLGTRGNLIAKDGRLWLEAGRQSTLVENLPQDPAADFLLQQFAQAIRTREAPETDGRAGMLAVAVLEAALRSARENRPVELSEFRVDPTPQPVQAN